MTQARTLTHVEDGRPSMVDVGGKAVTARTAVAESRVCLPAPVAAQLRAAGYASAKGPILHTAIVAGTMAAKRTHELIPFCHPLGLEKCRLTIEPDGDDLVIRCEVGVHHRTGVEMEALTGASVAALTIYDMCKALSHDLVIGPTRLVEKRGGRSDYDAGAASAGDDRGR
jgi:cyclic pyranopterin phosphate synthase